MQVFLVGVSCVGKTTIGRRLAERLGCTFFDLDQEIEQFFDTSIGPYGRERVMGRHKGVATCEFCHFVIRNWHFAMKIAGKMAFSVS